MLYIAIYDELKDQKPNVTDIIETAERQKDLPIGEIFYINPGRLIKSINKMDNIDIFMFSVTVVNDFLVDCAKMIRSTKINSYIIFVTNATKSNIQRLVRPSVGLSGLLFVPPEKSALYQTINEIATERALSGDEGEMFSIKSGSEYRRVPFRSILFFQAVEKKIVLATDKQEIEFYSSLSAITEQAPDYFTRCYKSYIVNTKFIVAVNVSLMEISLSNGFKIPLSRQYKNDFKRFFKEGEKVG